ncbi:MAG: hypothetical protein WA655_24225 [Candidatus Korobacteraceae bacterium]
MAGELYWRSHNQPKLTNKDTIVVADFDNKTGDAVFDATLKQALTIQLSQSPFLDLVSGSKVNETLKLMEHSTDDRLTSTVAREVCLRTGSRAAVTGWLRGISVGATNSGKEAFACHQCSIMDAFRKSWTIARLRIVRGASRSVLIAKIYPVGGVALQLHLGCMIL